MLHNPIMTNKDFQQLGKKPRLLEVFLLDDEGFRVRSLGQHEITKYSEKDLDKVYSKSYSLDSCEEAPY